MIWCRYDAMICTQCSSNTSLFVMLRFGFGAKLVVSELLYTICMNYVPYMHLHPWKMRFLFEQFSYSVLSIACGVVIHQKQV